MSLDKIGFKLGRKAVVMSIDGDVPLSASDCDSLAAVLTGLAAALRGGPPLGPVTYPIETEPAETEGPTMHVKPIYTIRYPKGLPKMRYGIGEPDR